MPSKPLPTNDELDLMSIDELKSFLREKAVGFGETELKPELLKVARGLVIEKRGQQPKEDGQKAPAEKTAPVIPQVEIPAETPVEDALKMLQIAGFKDREELVRYLGVFEREKADLENSKSQLRALQVDLEQQDIVMKERERAVVEQAKKVAIDLQKNADLYDKLDKLKQQGLSEQSI